MQRFCHKKILVGKQSNSVVIGRLLFGNVRILFHKTFTSIREIIAIYIPSAKRNDFVDCSHDRLVATQGSKGLHRGPSPSTKTPPGGPKRRGSGRPWNPEPLLMEPLSGPPGVFWCWWMCCEKELRPHNFKGMIVNAQQLIIWMYLPDISSRDSKVRSTVIKAQRFNLKRNMSI